jgi:hypothetical protein
VTATTPPAQTTPNPLPRTGLDIAPEIAIALGLLGAGISLRWRRPSG